MNLEQFSIKATYILYKDKSSQIKMDEQKTQLIKDRDSYYFKMGDAEMVYTPQFFIKVSHKEKMLLYSKLFGEENLTSSQIPLYILKNKYENKTVKNNNDNWECVMTGNNDISIPYQKIVFYVSKDTYHITKQVYYFKSTMTKKYTGKNNSAERLEIINTKFDKKIGYTDDKFSLSKYLKRNENKFTTSKYTKDYKIIIQ